MNAYARLRQLRLVAFVAALIFVLYGCADSNEGAGQARPAQPPPLVTLQTVSLEPVEVFGDFTGRVRGAREVEVRAQVGGILQQRLFTEGERIAAGTPMFQIERAPYEIALRRAEAELADARANLNQADREWQRVSGLHAQSVATERDRDRALSQLELTQARVALVQANVDQARLNLSYTQVLAPLDGATGLETRSEGNLIERGTLLATITQLDPIHVLFALPQNDRAARQAIELSSVAAATGVPLEVSLQLADGSTYAETGVVDFTSTTVDPQTGTVTARAVFANPGLAVRPGQFVRVRMLLETVEAGARIPASAVGQGPAGPTAFVVDDAMVTQRRQIGLGPVIDGQQIVIEGLSDGDRVVVNGHVALRGGETVRTASQGDR